MKYYTYVRTIGLVDDYDIRLEANTVRELFKSAYSTARKVTHNGACDKATFAIWKGVSVDTFYDIKIGKRLYVTYDANKQCYTLKWR